MTLKHKTPAYLPELLCQRVSFSVAEPENLSLRTDPGVTVGRGSPGTERRAPRPRAPPRPFLPSGAGLAERSQTCPADGSMMQPMPRLPAPAPLSPSPSSECLAARRRSQLLRTPDARRAAPPTDGRFLAGHNGCESTAWLSLPLGCFCGFRHNCCFGWLIGPDRYPSLRTLTQRRAGKADERALSKCFPPPLLLCRELHPRDPAVPSRSGPVSRGGRDSARPTIPATAARGHRRHVLRWSLAGAEAGCPAPSASSA